MADWFDKTNDADALVQSKYTRMVVHGQEVKGNPFGERNYILALSGKRHDDAAMLFREVADDEVFFDLSDALADMYRDFVDPAKSMFMVNLARQEDIDAGRHITNSHLPYFHLQVVTGDLREGKEHIAEDRTFHPHGRSDVHRLFRENADSIERRDAGQGLSVHKLPEDIAEAKEHYVITHEGYASFAAFMRDASAEEKRAFWHAVTEVSLPLIDDGGSRFGVYNLDGAINAEIGHMYVEITGGENLAADGKARWFQKPKPPGA